MNQARRETGVKKFSVLVSPKWVGQSAVIAVLVLAVAVSCTVLWKTWWFTADDAYISLRFVKNALAGNGLVWNPGERVEGYSNLLWVLVLWAAGALTGGDLVVLSKVGGLASYVMCVLGAIVFARRSLPWWGLCSLGAILFTHWPLLYYATSGMETVFYTALVVWLACCLATDVWRMERTLAMGLVLAALLLCRPEGILFAVLTCPCLFFLSRARGARRAALVAGLMAMAAFALLLIARSAYYGDWVPNTYYAKAPSSGQGMSPAYRILLGGFDEIADFLLWNGHVLFAVAAVYAIRRFNQTMPVWIVVLLVPLIFTKYAGGDWMLGYRFLLPAAPIYLAVALTGISTWLRPHVGVWTPALMAVLALALVITNVYGMLQFVRDQEQYPQFVMTSKDMAQAGRWLAEHYEADDSVVTHRIGAVGYYSGLVVIDTLGLCDRDMAQMIYERRKTKEAVQAYLTIRHPTLLLANRLASGAGKPPDEIHRAGGVFHFVRIFRQGNEQEWLLYERAAGGKEP